MREKGLKRVSKRERKWERNKVREVLRKRGLKRLYDREKESMCIIEGNLKRLEASRRTKWKQTLQNLPFLNKYSVVLDSVNCSSF